MKTNKTTIRFEELITFITNKYGSLGVVDESTRLEKGLGITGDEAYEFLSEYSIFFNVRISDFIFSDYFEAEGVNFIKTLLETLKLKKNDQKEKKTLTLGDLTRGIAKGELNEEVLK